MACHVYRTTEDGAKAFLCGRKLPAAALCDVCRKVSHEVLCDGREPGQRVSCDAKLCRGCAVHYDAGPDGTDFCPRHKDQAPPAEQMGLAL